MTDFSPYSPQGLPAIVTEYLDSQSDARGREAIADMFVPDGRVVDEGIEYLGVDAIRRWLRKTASAYAYTTTMIGQRGADATHWEVLARLEGDFPGGVVDLRYRFEIHGDRIIDLVIAP